MRYIADSSYYGKFPWRDVQDKGGAPRFSAPRWAVEEGYTRVMKGIVCDDYLRQSFLGPFTEAFWSGDPRRERTAYVGHLCYNEWSWPEFDHWRDIFLKDGQFPDLWYDYDRLESRARILWETICATIHSIETWNRGLEILHTESQSRRWAWRILCSCPVSQGYAEKLFDPRIPSLPPFFPGDNIGLVFEPNR